MDALAAVLPYLPVAIVAFVLNTADIFFLQDENTPPLQQSVGYWLYVLGHVSIACLAAFLLYEKAALPPSDWPIVTAVSTLSGFSLLQSLTLKFGNQGLDARDLFEAWKARVVEDISRVNASRKRARQWNLAQQLAQAGKDDPSLLSEAVRFLADAMGIDPTQQVKELADGKDATLERMRMSVWIATADLDYAERLIALKGGGDAS